MYAFPATCLSCSHLLCGSHKPCKSLLSGHGQLSNMSSNAPFTRRLGQSFCRIVGRCGHHEGPSGDCGQSPPQLNWRTCDVKGFANGLLRLTSAHCQDTEIQRCAPVQQLSAIKREMEASQSLVMRQVFSWLFPFGPGWNSGTNLPYTPDERVDNRVFFG